MFITSIFISGKGHHEGSGDQKAGQELPLLSGCGQDEILILSTTCKVPNAIPPATFKSHLMPSPGLTVPRHTTFLWVLFPKAEDKLFSTSESHTWLPLPGMSLLPHTSHCWLPLSPLV